MIIISTNKKICIYMDYKTVFLTIIIVSNFIALPNSTIDNSAILSHYHQKINIKNSTMQKNVLSKRLDKTQNLNELISDIEK